MMSRGLFIGQIGIGCRRRQCCWGRDKNKVSPWSSVCIMQRQTGRQGPLMVATSLVSDLQMNNCYFWASACLNMELESISKTSVSLRPPQSSVKSSVPSCRHTLLGLEEGLCVTTFLVQWHISVFFAVANV